MLCSFIYIKYETEALELSHKPEFFSNHLMRGAHLLFEFLRKDSLFCCSFLVFQLSCHLDGERIHKARLPTSTTHFPVQVACPHPLYQKTKRNSQDQDNEAMTNLKGPSRHKVDQRSFSVDCPWMACPDTIPKYI